MTIVHHVTDYGRWSSPRRPDPALTVTLAVAAIPAQELARMNARIRAQGGTR